MQQLLKVTLSVLVFFVAANTYAQKALTANQHADSVQKIRQQAGKLWGKHPPAPADITQSIEQLDSALAYLEQPVIRNLSQGNSYLYFRKTDIYGDLLAVYTLNHQYDKAIATLEKMYNGAPWDRSAIEKDSLYNALLTEPRFIEVLKKYKTRTALWNGSAFKTPLKDELSEDEKVAGLSQLWAQAKYNFVYLDRLTTDWNKTYMDYLPLVRASKSTREYYKVLQQFYAQLHDGHTNVYPPDELMKAFYSRPPIRTEMLEGRVFITRVSSDSLQKAGIVPGLEILKIDGEPVISYADKYVKPYQSSSTPQDLSVREFTYYLLSGDEFSPVSLELKDRKGKIWHQALKRNGYKDVRRTPAISFNKIGDVGHLVINSFENDSIIRIYDSLFASISQTRGLIIDIRNNGGGDGGIGYQILRTLTDKTFKLSAAQTMRYDAKFRGMIWYDEPVGSIAADPKRFYDKPIILLIGARTFSAAEDFAVAFDVLQRGKMVGQPTGGSTGQPISFNLPGGGWARVCAKKDTYPDGKQFVGIGIFPNVVVNETINDLFAGKDATLDAAVRMLK